MYAQYLATILYGLVRFFSQILGCFLLIRFPRRRLLAVSAILVSLVRKKSLSATLTEMQQ